MRASCSGSRGMTERRAIQTSGLRAKVGSALRAARETGRASGRSARRSTQTRLPAGSVGSG